MTILRRGANALRSDVDCTVVVVTYNSAREICGFLDSLAAAAPLSNLATVIVDNSSTDGTLRIVDEYREGHDPERGVLAPRITGVAAGGNLGYAGGINVGRRRHTDDSAVLIANPDLRFQPGAIDALLNMLDDPDVGIAVPKLLGPDGTLSRSLRREPSLTRELGEALFGDHLPNRPGFLSEIVRGRGAYDVVHDVDWATGAAFMMSSICDRVVGDWDESFFLYSEEIDAARRARQGGFRVRYEPDAVAVHDGAASGTSADLVALQAVNRVRYYEQHHGRWASAVHRAIVVMHELSRGSDAARRRSGAIVARRTRWADLPQ